MLWPSSWAVTAGVEALVPLRMMRENATVPSAVDHVSLPSEL